MQQQQGFHPVTDFKAGVFNTCSGKLIDFNKPSADDITIDDIGGALSKICRFGGQGNTFYSVAQHSILVSHLAPLEIRKEALLHDAAEAYLGDVIKPLKEMLGGRYKALEDEFDSIIATKFGLMTSPEVKAAIKIADNKALELEHAAFIMGRTAALDVTMFGYGLIINGALSWDWRTSFYQFQMRYLDLFGSFD